MTIVWMVAAFSSQRRVCDVAVGTIGCAARGGQRRGGAVLAGDSRRPSALERRPETTQEVEYRATADALEGVNSFVTDPTAAFAAAEAALAAGVMLPSRILR